MEEFVIAFTPVHSWSGVPETRDNVRSLISVGIHMLSVCGRWSHLVSGLSTPPPPCHGSDNLYLLNKNSQMEESESLAVEADIVHVHIMYTQIAHI